MKRQNIPFLILVFALLFAACGGAANDTANDNMPEDGLADMNYAAEDMAEEDVAYEVAAAEPAAPAEASGGLAVNQDQSANANFSPSEAIASNRIVIKDASLEMVVEDPASHMDAIIYKVESLGGFVVSTKLSSRKISDEVEIPTANMTIRVPALFFVDMLSAVEDGVVEVTSKKVTGKDITNAYTDMQSRLRNLESTAAQLELIMADAKKTEDVLKVYRELQAINEEAEVIRGQLSYAKEAASFSSITIRLSGPIPPAPLVKKNIRGWGRSDWGVMSIFLAAKEALLGFIQTFTGFLIWLVVFFIPFGLMLGIPAFIFWWLLKKARATLAAGTAPRPKVAKRTIE